MIKIIVYITYSLFKNMSLSKNSGYLERGLAVVSVNLTWHLLVIIKLISGVETFENLGIEKITEIGRAHV